MTITRITDAGQIHRHNKIILATNSPQNIAVQFIKRQDVDTSQLNDEEWAFMLVDNTLGYFTHDGDSKQDYDNRNGALHEISTQLNSFQSQYPDASIYFCDTADDIHIITLKDYFISVERKRQELGNFDEIRKPWWTNKWYMVGTGVAIIVIGGGAYWWWSQKQKKLTNEDDSANSDGDDGDGDGSGDDGSSKGSTSKKKVHKSKSRRKHNIPDFEDYDIDEGNYSE